MIKRLFWNPEQQRVTMVWRLVLQIVLLVLLMSPLSLLRGLMMRSTMSVPVAGFAVPTQTLFLIVAVLRPALTLAAFVGSIWLAGRVLDRRRFADFGLHLDGAWWLDLGFGLALGAVLMGLIFLVEWRTGWVTVEAVMRPPAPDSSLAGLLLIELWAFVGVGIQEELFSRGYQLKNLSEGLHALRRVGPRTALILATLISAAIFGLLHAANPNATLISTVNIMLAGLMLSLGTLLTGELAIPIGLHITWNFFQGNVFGFPVSGGTSFVSVLTIEQHGHPLVTGGAFGPEAGLIGVAAMGLGCALTVLWLRWRRGPVRLAMAFATPDLLTGEDELTPPTTVHVTHSHPLEG
jgi:hypothetical protein